MARISKPATNAFFMGVAPLRGSPRIPQSSDPPKCPYTDILPHICQLVKICESLAKWPISESFISCKGLSSHSHGPYLSSARDAMHARQPRIAPDGSAYLSYYACIVYAVCSSRDCRFDGECSWHRSCSIHAFNICLRNSKKTTTNIACAYGRRTTKRKFFPCSRGYCPVQARTTSNEIGHFVSFDSERIDRGPEKKTSALCLIC